MNSETQQASKASYTPGPWQLSAREVEESFEGFTFKRRAIYGTQSAVLIANVCGPEIRCEMHAHNEFSANARLIAAAPELLAELTHCIEIMVRAVGERLPIQQGTHSEEQDWETALRKARAIIARATGTELEVNK